MPSIDIQQKIIQANALFNKLSKKNSSIRNNPYIHSFIERTIMQKPDIDINFVQKLAATKIKYAAGFYGMREYGRNTSYFYHALKPSKITNSVKLFFVRPHEEGIAKYVYQNKIQLLQWKKEHIEKKTAILKHTRIKRIDKKIRDIEIAQQVVGDDEMLLSETRQTWQSLQSTAHHHLEEYKKTLPSPLFHELNHSVCNGVRIVKLVDKHNKEHWVRVTAENASRYKGYIYEKYEAGVFCGTGVLQTILDDLQGKYIDVEFLDYTSTGAKYVIEGMTEALAQRMTDFTGDTCGYEDIYPYISTLDIFSNHKMVDAYYDDITQSNVLKDNMYLTSLIRVMDEYGNNGRLYLNKECEQKMDYIIQVQFANARQNDPDFENKLKEMSQDKWIKEKFDIKKNKSLKKILSLNKEKLADFVSIGNETLKVLYVTHRNLEELNSEDKVTKTYVNYKNNHPIVLQRVIEDEADVLPLMDNGILEQDTLSKPL